MKQSVYTLLCMSSGQAYKYPDSLIHTVVRPLNDNANKPYVHRDDMPHVKEENWATNDEDEAYVSTHQLDLGEEAFVGVRQKMTDFGQMVSDSESSSSDEESSGDEKEEDDQKVQLDLYSASAIEVQNAIEQTMQQGSDPVCPSSGCETLRTAGLNYTHPNETLKKKKWGNYTPDGSWEIKNVTSSWPDDSPLFANPNATHPAPIPESTNRTLNESLHSEQNVTNGSNRTNASANNSNRTNATNATTAANASATPVAAVAQDRAAANAINVVTRILEKLNSTQEASATLTQVNMGNSTTDCSKHQPLEKVDHCKYPSLNVTNAKPKYDKVCSSADGCIPSSSNASNSTNSSLIQVNSRNCSEHQTKFDNCTYKSPNVTSAKSKFDKVCASPDGCIPSSTNASNASNTSNASNVTEEVTSLIQKKIALTVVTNISNSTNQTASANLTAPANSTQANETEAVYPNSTQNETGEDASNDNRESTTRNSDKDKTFFLPPRVKSEKEKPSWKNPFPDRIGKQVNGTWVIPNVTTKGNTTFTNTTTEVTSDVNSTTETNSTVESNTTVSANGTSQRNISSETNTTTETNVSADSNVTASTLIQLGIYNGSEVANVSDAPNLAPGRPATVKGRYYDADGGYWPEPVLLSLVQLFEDPPVASTEVEGNVTFRDSNEKPDAQGISTARVNLTGNASAPVANVSSAQNATNSTDATNATNSSSANPIQRDYYTEGEKLIPAADNATTANEKPGNYSNQPVAVTPADLDLVETDDCPACSSCGYDCGCTASCSTGCGNCVGVSNILPIIVDTRPTVYHIDTRPSIIDVKDRIGYYNPQGKWIVPSTGINNTATIAPETTTSVTVEAPGLVQTFPDIDPKNPRIGNYSADGQWVIPTRNLGNLSLEILQNLTNGTNSTSASQKFPDNDPKNPRIGNYSTEGEWVIPLSKLEEWNEVYNKNLTNSSTASNVTLIEFKVEKQMQDFNASSPRIGNYTFDGEWVIPKSGLEKWNEEYNKNLTNQTTSNTTMIQIKYKMFPDIDPKNPRIGNYSTDGQWIIPQDIFLNGTGPSVNVTAANVTVTNVSASNASLTVVNKLNATRIGHYDPNGTWVLPPSILDPEEGNPHAYSNATLSHVRQFPDIDPKNPRIGNYTPDGKWVVPADIFLNSTWATNASTNASNGNANGTLAHVGSLAHLGKQVYPDLDPRNPRVGNYSADGQWIIPTRNLGNLSLEILQNLTNSTSNTSSLHQKFPDNDPKNPRIGNYSTEGEWVIPKSKIANTTYEEIMHILNPANGTNSTNSTSNETALVQMRSQKSSDPCVGLGCDRYNMPKPPAEPEAPRIGYYTPDGEWIVPHKNGTIVANNSSVNATSLLQLSEEIQSDPIYGSAWVSKPKKGAPPRDYYVPDFGLDQDMRATLSSIAESEKRVGKWRPKKSEDGEYIVPQVEAEFKLKNMIHDY